MDEDIIRVASYRSSNWARSHSTAISRAPSARRCTIEVPELCELHVQKDCDKGRPPDYDSFRYIASCLRFHAQPWKHSLAASYDDQISVLVLRYHVSIRQIYEVENKLRLQSTLPTVSTGQHWESVRKQVVALLPTCNIVVTSEALTKVQDVLPVLVYVAGYAVYVPLKKLNCARCRDSMIVDMKIAVSAAHEHYALVKQLDRGGLVYPSMFALNAVAYSYVVVEQLATLPTLLVVPEQRQIVTKLTLQLLASEVQSDLDTCDNGHTSELVLKHILRCSSNVLLKNFCRKLNDKLLDAADKSKKRKATTLEAK
uniref:Uncharacterized protein n=1 Tax=Rhipicephalus pulchellus TaxID=72859 RepID=L7M0C7_RHIPC